MPHRKYARCAKNERGWYVIRDPQTRREWASILHHRQNGLCALCGFRFASDDVNEALRKAYGPTFDHIVPYAAGGSSDIENLRLVHYLCNLRRASGKPLTPGMIPRRLR
jgi:5-methylcytosine-specific restriction endonuclease McrA